MAARPMVMPAPKGNSIYGVVDEQRGGKTVMNAPVNGKALTLDDLLADPEGTVFSGPYDSETAAFTGYQNSDQGRPQNASKYYQYYSGCPYSINAVRVVGMFNYWDEVDYEWYMCGDRPGYDENYNMTNPVTFEVSFYRIGDDGMPGECVYTKNIPLKGRYVGAVYGMEGNQGPLMEFIADLGEEVKLETGFMSFSAAKIDGETPSCWFSLFTATSSFGYGMVDMTPYGYIGANPCVFSLIGPGDLAASKALKIVGLQAPVSVSSGTHETVRVALSNVGAEPISDITLQLYVDNKLVATEKPGITLASLADHNYTFAQRVDLSAPGKHVVTVKNVTPGDENTSLADASVETTTLAEGEKTPSGGAYSYEEDAIVRVSVGDIDNTSGPADDGYEDFTNISTDITVGMTLQLTAEFNPDGDGGYIGAWVDWNNDGLFTGEGEFMGYLLDDYIPVAIPEGLSMTPGAKTLRVVGNTGGDAPAPHGEYYYGQTEDYTLNVVRPGNSAAAVVDVRELESEVSENVSVLDFVLSNEGDVTLDGNITITYELPAVYEQRESVAAAPENVAVKRAKKVLPAAQVAADEDVVHVLRYDSGQYDAIGVGNFDDAIFGQYYPAEIMQSICGMKISSIDAYINEVPRTAIAQIYEKNGDDYVVVAEKEFTPVAESWNHVVFDTPHTISGKDLIYAVKIVGMIPDRYYIGIDKSSAVRGYGDLCNVGGSTWWSMADLGIDSNFCVRANVTGEPTAEISWLSVDKKQVSVEAGKSEKIAATVDGKNLLGGTYEARIVLSSNDPLSPSLSIPVYLTKSMSSGLDISTLKNSEVKVAGDKLMVVSDKEINTVVVTGVAGITTVRETVSGNSVAVSLDNCESGVYVVGIKYADGSSDNVKMVIKR